MLFYADDLLSNKVYVGLLKVLIARTATTEIVGQQSQIASVVMLYFAGTHVVLFLLLNDLRHVSWLSSSQTAVHHAHGRHCSCRSRCRLSSNADGRRDSLSSIEPFDEPRILLHAGAMLNQFACRNQQYLRTAFHQRSRKTTAASSRTISLDGSTSFSAWNKLLPNTNGIRCN